MKNFSMPASRLTQIAAACLLVSACGGGGSDDNPGPAVDPAVNDVATEDLKLTALNSIGSGINTASTSAGDVINENNDTLGNTPLDGALGEDDTLVDTSATLFDDDANSLLATTLALGDADESMTSRDGTRITIDPDEAEICGENGLGSQADQLEFERCQALMADLTVQLDVTSETAGSISYQFQNSPLITLGYTANSDSFELNLGGLQRLTLADAELDPDVSVSSISNTVSGAFRVTSTVSNSSFGAEAGSLALEITEAISISGSDDGESAQITMAVGEILSMTTDAADDSGNITINLGQLSLEQTVDEELNNLNLAGLTAVMDLNQEEGRFRVSNFGLGSGPFTVGIASEEVVRLTMETFGFTILEDNGNSVLIDGTLDISLFVESQFEEFDGVNFTSGTVENLLTLSAPGGTEIAEQINGALRVNNGGPLSYSLSTTQDGMTNNNAVTIAAGQCADQQGEDDQLAIVPCN